MTPFEPDLTGRVRTLNDQFRITFEGGDVLVTRGVRDQGALLLLKATLGVQAFRDFTEDNDPHGEHDFGSVDVAGQTVFWKIDYYDRRKECASPDPADPEVTCRVMTIMLADEC